jgi:hypothetical protein
MREHICILTALDLFTAAPQQPAKPRLSTAIILHTHTEVPRDEQQFTLTSVAQGVAFDLDADGISEQTAWTATDSKLAFLAIDRNGNRTIDDGAELFENHTPTRATNGIEAMIRMLKASGAPLYGALQAGDSVHEQLLLWEGRESQRRVYAGEQLLGRPQLSGLSRSRLQGRPNRSLLVQRCCKHDL